MDERSSGSASPEYSLARGAIGGLSTRPLTLQGGILVTPMRAMNAVRHRFTARAPRRRSARAAN